MDYKLIALDLDGTLTNSRKEITPRTRYALLDAQAQGKKIILASGRHPLGVYPIARDLHLDRYGGYIMSFNGGKIIECATDRTIVTKLFPREYLPDIMSVLQDSNLTVITWDDKRIFANNKVNDYTYIEKDVLKIEMVVVDDFLSSIKFDVNKILLAGEPDELDEYQKLLYFQGLHAAAAAREAAHQPRGADRLWRQLQRYDHDRLRRHGRRNGKRRAGDQKDRQLCLSLQR